MQNQSFSVPHSQGLGLGVFGFTVFGLSMVALSFASVEFGLFIGPLFGI